MAIAFDAAVLAQANAVTSNTFSHTITGTNPGFVCGVQFATGTDVGSTKTYNGAAMTLVTNQALAGATFDKTYAYYAAAPATGAHNCVISNTGGANYIYAASGSYTDVDQTTVVEASAVGNTTGTTLSQAVTTLSNNAWLVAFGSEASTGAVLSAGTSTTLRTTSTSWDVWLDSNAAKTPAGSYSLAVNAGASGKLGLIVMAIKPFGAAPVVASVSTLMMMGV